MLAFSTARQGLPRSERGSQDEPVTVEVQMLADAFIDPLFDAAVDATEAAIVNALLAAETMTGRDGITAHGLDPALLRGVLRDLDAGPSAQI